jgi:hypothetical protein
VRLAPAAAACLLLAAASLALPSALGYDPHAWLVWGRELAHLDLSTTAGPSFKPLPALLAAPLSPLGDLVPEAWMLIVRTLGLLGVVFAFRIAARFAGTLAGATAALATALAEGQVRHGLLGYSEPLLIGLTRGAIDMHRCGRRRWAFGLGALGALVRPELWALVALYGAYLWLADPGFRAGVAATLVLVPVLWVGLDWWGSGDLLHGGSVARSTPPESAALTDRPAFTVVRRAAELVTAPVVLAAVAAVALAVRRRVTVVVVLGAATAAWVATVALMAEAGFTGNIRYLAVPSGLLATLGGIGVGWLVAAFEPGRARLVAGAGAAVVLAGFWVAPVRTSADWVSAAREQHDQLAELDDAVERAGGHEAVSARGRPAINPWVQTALAWKLDVPLSDIQPTWRSTPAHPGWAPPALVFRAPARFAGPVPSLAGRPLDLLPVAHEGRWTVVFASPAPAG